MMESAGLFAAAVTTAAGAGAGWLAGWWLVPKVARLLGEAGYAHPNYADERIPVGAGLGVVFGAFAGWALAAFIIKLIDPKGGALGFLGAMALTAVGFGLVGLFDDLVGRTSGGGFRGHFRLLIREGTLTTGAFKALGGVVVALITASLLMSYDAGSGTPFAPSPAVAGSLLANGAIIALTANFVNLLDLRPGRALKGFFLLLAVALAAAWWTLGYLRAFGQVLVAVAPIVGAAAAAFPGDLRARFMLGDVGANAVGASVGVVFATLGVEARLVVLAVLLALTILSERVSFSRLIEHSRVLTSIDRWGRR